MILWRNNGVNKRGAWNKRGGAKFEPFLINVVAEIVVGVDRVVGVKFSEN